MCPGDYNGVSEWILSMERSGMNAKKGLKRSAFEFATEFTEHTKEHEHGQRKKKRLMIFEDRHILMKGIAQLCVFHHIEFT